MILVFLLMTYFAECHIHVATNGLLQTCPRWYPSQEYKAYQPIRFSIWEAVDPLSFCHNKLAKIAYDKVQQV